MSKQTSLLVAGFLLATSMLWPITGSADTSGIDRHRELTVGILVDAVLAGNGRLEAARERLEAARARVEPAAALDDPRVTYGVAPGTADGTKTPAGESRGLNQRIEIRQRLPWPGKLGLREDVAAFEAQAQKDDRAAVRLQLEALAKAAYADWFHVREALAINAASRALVDELRRTAELRYASGLAERGDVLRAESRLQQLRRQRLQLDRRAQQAVATINALLNRAPGATLPRPAAWPAERPLPDIALLQERALEQHPQLAGLNDRIAASNARERLARADFKPDFDVFLGYNGLWNNRDKRWLVGVSINIPIGRSKRNARVDEAVATTRSHRADLLDRRAQLRADIHHAHAAVREALADIALHREELLPLAAETLSAARSEYSSGVGRFLEVIDAEQQQLNAELGLVRARADYLIAMARLERWTGGPVPSGSTSKP